jgi:hypothetical protein
LQPHESLLQNGRWNSEAASAIGVNREHPLAKGSFEEMWIQRAPPARARTEIRAQQLRAGSFDFGAFDDGHGIRVLPPFDAFRATVDVSWIHGKKVGAEAPVLVVREPPRGTGLTVM